MRNILKIILCLFLISISVLSVAASYAYFQSNVTGNVNAKSNVVKSGKMELNFKDGEEINCKDIFPGWVGLKRFTVTNTGTFSLKYDINFNNLTNTFVNKQDLIYNLVSTSSDKNINLQNVSDTVLPDTGNNINIAQYEIKPNEVHSFILEIKYLNRNYNQNSDMGKTLIGKLEVVSTESTKKETNIPLTMETMLLSEKANIGDYVDYTSSSDATNKSISCYYGNPVNNGYRVLNKEKKSIEIIHAGVPECLEYNRDSKNTLDNINNVLKNYLNKNIATKVRSVDCNDLKKFDKKACKNNIRIQNDLVNVGTYYWLGDKKDKRYINFIDYLGYASNTYGVTLGIRPVIKLKNDIIIKGGNGSKEHPYKIDI